jgi:ubiquinone/menaquinone biosynthesis C-methylase UbiE
MVPRRIACTGHCMSGMAMHESDTPIAARSPAQVYEQFFVPALFRQWGVVIADMAGIAPGHRVLDVACGTGVLACAAAERVGADGAVTGLDPNDEMLAVARGKSARIEWRKGRAESLPFAEASFDRAASQFGLMFFEDKAAGLREMMRVLRPGGRLAAAVCDALDHSPGYAVLAELLQRLFGAAVADAFRAPFALGERKGLRSLCEQAGMPTAQVTRAEGTVRFRSIEALVSTERACVWTLGGLLDDRQFDRLLEEAEESLQPFVTADGAVAFQMPALVITADKV